MRQQLRPVEGTHQPGAAATASLARAAAVLTRMLPTSTVTSAEFDEAGELVAITVRHRISDLVSQANYRTRVEAAMTLTHRTQWIGQWDLSDGTARFEKAQEEA